MFGKRERISFENQHAVLCILPGFELRSFTWAEDNLEASVIHFCMYWFLSSKVLYKFFVVFILAYIFVMFHCLQIKKYIYKKNQSFFLLYILKSISFLVAFHRFSFISQGFKADFVNCLMRKNMISKCHNSNHKEIRKNYKTKPEVESVFEWWVYLHWHIPAGRRKIKKTYFIREA